MRDAAVKQLPERPFVRRRAKVCVRPSGRPFQTQASAHADGAHEPDPLFHRSLVDDGYVAYAGLRIHRPEADQGRNAG